MTAPIDRFTLGSQGWRRVYNIDVPAGADCRDCGYPGLDALDEYDRVSAILSPEGNTYCGWACAVSAARARAFRAAQWGGAQ